MEKRQIDRGTLAGVLIAVSGVVAGLLLDGGSIRQILQPTAALIVLGGTIGAVLIQFPLDTVMEAALHVRDAFLAMRPMGAEHVEQLVGWCQQGRKQGLVALDPLLEEIEDEFLKKSLTLAVDGLAMRQMQEVLELDLDLYEERAEGVVRVLEAAGGFAPTLGIIGAVLGLIQVMQRMDNVGEIGKGIAVAFVSTLYGIGVANLVFLPLAGKLRIRFREEQRLREMTLDAVIAMVEGVTPRGLRERLQAYVVEGRPRAQEQPEPEMATL